MTKLVLKNVTCRFGAVTAVDDFSLSMEQGEFVSLLGPSGCGKTTTPLLEESHDIRTVQELLGHGVRSPADRMFLS